MPDKVDRRKGFLFSQYTRLCARFPEFTIGGDSNVLMIGRKAEGGLYIVNGKKILFGAACDGLLLFLMRGAY